jgi:hypothetical protein
MIKTTRNILVCIILFCALAPALLGQSNQPRSTPRDHYKTYDVERAPKPKKRMKTRFKEFAQTCLVKIVVDFLAPKPD